MKLDPRRLPGAVGVELTDVDVKRFGEGEVGQLKALLAEHHLVAVRAQSLSPRELGAFARRLGRPEEYPFAEALDDDPFVVPIVKEPEDTSNFGGIWHTDSSYLAEPPGETLLYAVQIPSRGGDTWYADTQAAFEALSPAMQRFLEGLEGEYTSKLVHDAAGEHAHVAGADRNRREAGEKVTETVHPVVRTHPVSGRKALYATLAHTRRFVGFTREESLPILEFLERHATQEKFCTRLVWGQGTLALWDNRAVFHYPLNDYPGERREMHRVILAGERPR
jgi:taurine dioxygenase